MKTLATIFFSLVAIVASLVFVLSALCASSTSIGNDQDRHFFMLVALGALVIVIASMRKIVILNRKPRPILRESDPQVPPDSIVLPSAPPPPPEPATTQSRSIPSSDVPRASSPTVPPYVPRDPIQPRVPDVVRHLSPASQTAIQQLAVAIAAKVLAQVALGLVGWHGALRSHGAPFPLFTFGFLAWGLAALAPHLVLLYGLARWPGPLAFAFALVIPALHILFAIVGRSAFTVFILNSGQVAAPLLSVFPWILDIVILYLALKAIRLTGMRPDPNRLIVASIVIVLYTTLLPSLVVLLNYFAP